MFSNEEFEHYKPMFDSIRVDDKQMQQKMLEFFYNFGAMCFNELNNNNNNNNDLKDYQE